MIKAGKGKVVVRVHGKTDGMGDGTIIVSERSETRGMEGTILSIDSDIAKVGDLVHIPHNDVSDYLEDIAIFPASRLFAKRVDGAWEPINKNVLVNKCRNQDILGAAGELVLYMTEVFKEETSWVEVLKVSKDCQSINKSNIGQFCIAPETSDRLARLGWTEVFCLGEEEIEWLTLG